MALCVAAAGFAVVSAATAVHAATRGMKTPALVQVRVADGLVEDRAVGVVVAEDRVLTVAHVLGDPAAGDTPGTASPRWSRMSTSGVEILDHRAAGGRGWSRVSTTGGDNLDHPAAGTAARVVAVDRAADLALLAAPGVGGSPVTLAPAAPRDVAVALPSGRRPARATALRATFTDVLGTTVRRPVLRLDTAVAPGDSGSPVLDGRGRLAGLVFAADRTSIGTSWATAAPALRRLLDLPR